MATMADATPRRLAPLALALALAGAVGGCAENQVFDSAAYLRELYAKRTSAERAAAMEVPFELAPDLRSLVEAAIKPARDEELRADQVQRFIFRELGLRYSLQPTRNATETFLAREGNCMSFVNLFVGIARQLRLNPVYVEVTDHNRWHYREGMVVSQGHIVAGIWEGGYLRTYDFLPYQPKAYRELSPVDDLTAAAIYYNNLAGEALLAGDTERALELVTIATEISPTLDKAINNRGVCLARLGRNEEALAVLLRGLEIDPGNAAMLSNLVRVYQNLGETEKAAEVLTEIEGLRIANPFFWVYKGELALSLGDNQRALEHMREALRVDSEIPEIHVGLTKVYLALGDLEKARHHLERALKLDATNLDARRLAQMLQAHHAD